VYKKIVAFGVVGWYKYKQQIEPKEGA